MGLMRCVPDSVDNTLASCVPWLRKADDDWRLRIVLHDFGLVWQQTPTAERLGLVHTEPASVDAPWDAFLAAYVEHDCWHDGVDTPEWVFAKRNCSR